MNDISDTNNGIPSETISDMEQNNLDTAAQILTTCLEEYPNAQLEIIDYKKIYETGERSAELPHLSDSHDLEYQYFILPLNKKGLSATLGIPVFAQGFMEKIQDRDNSDTQYIIYPYRNCSKIDILKFPTELLKPFYTNDVLREEIVRGANMDVDTTANITPELKQRFEAIKKISGKFNSKA